MGQPSVYSMCASTAVLAGVVRPRLIAHERVVANHDAANTNFQFSAAVGSPCGVVIQRGGERTASWSGGALGQSGRLRSGVAFALPDVGGRHAHHFADRVQHLAFVRLEHPAFALESVRGRQGNPVVAARGEAVGVYARLVEQFGEAESHVHTQHNLASGGNKSTLLCARLDYV